MFRQLAPVFFYLMVLTALPLKVTAADAKRGAELYQACITCHGEKGEGNPEQEAPKIARQHDWYIVTQLKNFREKTRSNPKMYPFIKDLTDQDYEDLAAYIAQLK